MSPIRQWPLSSRDGLAVRQALGFEPFKGLTGLISWWQVMPTQQNYFTFIWKPLCTTEIYCFSNIILPTNPDQYIGPVLFNPSLDQEQEMCHGFLLQESYSKLPFPSPLQQGMSDLHHSLQWHGSNLFGCLRYWWRTQYFSCLAWLSDRFGSLGSSWLWLQGQNKSSKFSLRGFETLLK